MFHHAFEVEPQLQICQLFQGDNIQLFNVDKYFVGLKQTAANSLMLQSLWSK